jgi:hypothetical protein
MGRRVWLFELWNFLFRDRRKPRDLSLEEFWGAPQDAEERSLQVVGLRVLAPPIDGLRRSPGAPS